jgi:hypothetical protein
MPGVERLEHPAYEGEKIILKYIIINTCQIK